MRGSSRPASQLATPTFPLCPASHRLHTLQAQGPSTQPSPITLQPLPAAQWAVLPRPAHPPTNPNLLCRLRTTASSTPPSCASSCCPRPTSPRRSWRSRWTHPSARGRPFTPPSSASSPRVGAGLGWAAGAVWGEFCAPASYAGRECGGRLLEPALALQQPGRPRAVEHRWLMSPAVLAECLQMRT